MQKRKLIGHNKSNKKEKVRLEKGQVLELKEISEKTCKKYGLDSEEVVVVSEELEIAKEDTSLIESTLINYVLSFPNHPSLDKNRLSFCQLIGGKETLEVVSHC